VCIRLHVPRRAGRHGYVTAGLNRKDPGRYAGYPAGLSACGYEGCRVYSGLPVPAGPARGADRMAVGAGAGMWAGGTCVSSGPKCHDLPRSTKVSDPSTHVPPRCPENTCPRPAAREPLPRGRCLHRV
jgi:hypothetical protein